MKHTRNLLWFVFIIVALSGCAAVLVPATSDPNKKIEYAYQLFDQQQRPLPAERLINEAIAAYLQDNDEMGLAEAYRAYGFFFRSRSIEKWHAFYEKNGFLNKTATYDNRYDMSIEYFGRSAQLFAKNSRYDKLTNIYLNMGFTYEFAGKNDKACEAYKKSLETNTKFRKGNPTASTTLPNGFVGTYEDYIDGILKRLGCK